MCGIVAASAQRDVVPILLEGLRRLEYRGYDSAGLAVQDGPLLHRVRRRGKVRELSDALDSEPLHGTTGLAHTRWATHGVPSEHNAHPHVSGESLAIVHNGIIENHRELRQQLVGLGYGFSSETDTEVIAHRIDVHYGRSGDLQEAVQATVAELQGAYALVAVHRDEPGRLVVARAGCPVVIGLGLGENFVASDVNALLPVTRRFMFLEEGDVAIVQRDSIRVFGANGAEVTRPVRESQLSAEAVDRGGYRHYMLKEIHEQATAVADTLAERLSRETVLPAAFGPAAEALLAQVEAVHIVACGTSYHAGLVARYQIEELCRVPVNVEIASEFRYRSPVVPANTLFIAISQSGETADTLAALRAAAGMGYATRLAICNVPESSLVREADLTLLTRAGPEIGVASTKAFTTQLAAFGLVALALARVRGQLGKDAERERVRELLDLPSMIERTLGLDAQIAQLAELFADKRHALFLGRGALNPVAMEGALKLKEISYIHAEAYAAGELKHGPLALVDDEMPVVAVAPSDELLEKLLSNLQEVRARGGQLIVFADSDVSIDEEPGVTVLRLPVHARPLQAPLLFTIPLQLLAYHVAVLKGTDVDQPRNLAKSVTVE